MNSSFRLGMYPDATTHADNHFAFRSMHNVCILPGHPGPEHISGGRKDCRDNTSILGVMSQLPYTLG